MTQAQYIWLVVSVAGLLIALVRTIDWKAEYKRGKDQ
jgi:hypothetical protein